LQGSAQSCTVAPRDFYHAARFLCATAVSLLRRTHEARGARPRRETRVIVLDEPLSALDASVQAQVANLLVELARDLGMGMLLISHDWPSCGMSRIAPRSCISARSSRRPTGCRFHPRCAYAFERWRRSSGYRRRWSATRAASAPPGRAARARAAATDAGLPRAANRASGASGGPRGARTDRGPARVAWLHV
jgi:hypothetical protein